MRTSFAQILDKDAERLRAKALLKLPESGAELEIPSSLALEQCSSEATARYKAVLASKLCAKPGKAALADLTGGLGIDTLAYSKVFARVLYNERDKTLAEAAKRNFTALGASGIQFSSCDVGAESTEWKAVLEGFRPELIYLDPARRDACGGKVVLPEQCSPDLTAILPYLLETAPLLLVKYSPMADISLLRARLEGPLSQVHIVEKDGECKELLLVFEAGFKGTEPEITVADARLGAFFSFLPSDEKNVSAPETASPEEIRYIFEPGAALMKSGAFKLTAGRFGLRPLSAGVRLFASYSLPPEECEAAWKIFRLEEILPFGREGFRSAGKKYPRAEVSARGIPMTSEQLKERMGCLGGGEVHIFGTVCASGRCLLACSPIPRDNS